MNSRYWTTFQYVNQKKNIIQSKHSKNNNITIKKLVYNENEIRYLVLLYLHIVD